VTALVWVTFDGEGPFLRARARVLASERRIVGEWTPYATKSLATAGGGAEGIRAGAAIAGVIGGAGLLALTAWSAVLAYPFNSGERPLWSWPAYIAAPVEFGALCAGIGGVVLFFRRAGLTRLNHPAFDQPEVDRASLDSFVLAVRCDAGEDANALVALLAETGARHSRVQVP